MLSIHPSIFYTCYCGGLLGLNLQPSCCKATVRTTALPPLFGIFFSFLLYMCATDLVSHRGLLLVPSHIVTRQNVDLLNDAFKTALVFCHVSLRNSQMESQYQRSVPLEVRRAEGERVRAKHPDKIPVSSV